ncbi:hypothetical protein K443DRAFT_152809 [Laccaria amethystina LaAM-08-1]|uniref:Unplaced genomic scaffold K443scaffold_10, whole genome shotgun sequence n=1 Tax=Laccaria amethystina LaAM-08-1 TaxID=1095629 RepID=A0A0C9X6N3_9AGAR|nr:hypothetical protein K443DRAFT_152809 [Laccaria amethystina LaAM-08-1]
MWGASLGLVQYKRLKRLPNCYQLFLYYRVCRGAYRLPRQQVVVASFSFAQTVKQGDRQDIQFRVFTSSPPLVFEEVVLTSGDEPVPLEQATPAENRLAYETVQLPMRPIMYSFSEISKFHDSNPSL